jgi:hypothetical protein
MTTPARFAYADTAASRAEGSLLAYLPITLRHGIHVVTVPRLLDTGSTVNVLPYPVGLQLGLLWEQQPTQVHLTGSLARLPARGVIVSGQVNVFMEFDVCFFRSQAAFEVNPKSTAN